MLPALHEQDGYEGGYVLTTPEGKALVLTFWATRRPPRPASRAGFYAEQVEKFVTHLSARRPAARRTTSSIADAPARRSADGRR